MESDAQRRKKKVKRIALFHYKIAQRERKGHLQDVDDAHEVDLVHPPGWGDASVVGLEYRPHVRA